MNKQYWNNKNVFVTGCSGFLGSHMVKTLTAAGANVTGLIRDYTPKSYLYNTENQKINLVTGSLEDEQLLERVLGEYETDTVFHLAAQAIISVANRNPLSTFNSNIMGTCSLLEACRRSPLVKKIIVASSDKAYGDQEVLPYNEEMPLKGRHPYDVSKSCADLIAQAYHKTYGLPVCITRCGNLYGGGDLNFNRIIPQTIKSVLNGEAPVIRSDGTFIRDYIYVEDAAMAYIFLSEKMDNSKLHGEAFNISTEVRFTVLELVNKILVLMDSDLDPVILNQGSNEIKKQYLSTKKIRETLGWKPQYTIDEGLKLTIDWYREYLKNTTSHILNKKGGE
ncbi:MAG TPA: GDP-mannose 4,6-dehydratase [Bacillota bacterium]|nr:GDP-mannose 4,6-dehydratase [Bacillota bacterium]HPL52738.1 GDP-mannose 4,6-dehydratase [Bacillota bacterium]